MAGTPQSFESPAARKAAASRSCSPNVTKVRTRGVATEVVMAVVPEKAVRKS
jgi:hypothetical protein